MELTVNKQNLSKKLTFASHFTSSRAQLPILNNICLIAKNNSLKIMATNLETSFYASLGVSVKKDGSIALPSRTFSELVSNINGENIDLTADAENLIINADGFNGKVLGVNTLDFPLVPEKVSDNALLIKSKELLIALNKILFSVGKDVARPNLTGVLFKFEDKKLVLVSSDGFRLSQTEIILDDDKLTGEYIVPKNILLELTKLLESSSEVFLDILKEDNQIIFSVSDLVISSRLIEGNFPDYKKIIPVTLPVKVYVSKSDLQNAIKIASVFAREEANVISFEVNESSVSISTKSSKSGEQKSEIPARIEGISVAASFNYRFLEEFLNVIQSNEIVVNLKDSSTPTVFLDTKEENYLHLIMPVRVKE